jgi:hypothetical protein
MLSPIVCQEIAGLIYGGDASGGSDEKRFVESSESVCKEAVRIR